VNALWTSQDMEAATLGHATRAFEVGGISIDTRTLQPGDFFVALKGDARDGHEFVETALKAGAAAALVAQHPAGFAPDAPLLRVGHTQRALEDLGRAARARSRARIVAITGSAGKTTTKEMLRLALEALGPTSASQASYNNHWGVPLTLARMPAGDAFGVFEIGMNHFGEIRALAGFVRPEVAIVTTIAAAHLEFFGNCEAIADAKSEIFESLQPGGAAIVPSDNAYTARLVARAKQAHVPRLLTFGNAAGSSARLLSCAEIAGGMQIDAEILGRRCRFRLGASGAHLASNALAALLAVAALDGDVLNAAAALSSFAALKGRGARAAIHAKDGAAELIDESYNANPASVRAALAVLGSARPRPSGRRIAVLGDMLELGAESVSLHAGLADAVEASQADLVFCCGPAMHALFEAIPAARRGAYGKSSAEIAPLVVHALRAGDIVLVKGSFGSRMAVIVDALKAQGRVA
jgi:UDP-N-acetylmuramoyl-tripeptide--D-alanyl-D-alanine ligase